MSSLQGVKMQWAEVNNKYTQKTSQVFHMLEGMSAREKVEEEEGEWKYQ